MNPDSENNTYVSPQEYLDQISTKKPRGFRYLDKKIVVLVSAVVLLVIVVIVWFAVSSAPKTSSASELLAVRLQNMSSLLEYDSSKVIDSQSKKAIAETKIVFASNNYQLSQSMTLTVNSEIATQEPITEKITALDNAAATNNLSREYVSALNTQINQLIISLEEVQLSSNNIVIEQALLDLFELSNRLSSN